MRRAAEGFGGAVLEMWFGAPGSDIFGKPRKEWFFGNTFDAAFPRFMTDYESILAGEYDPEVQSSPLTCLAAIILLDQGARTMFAGTKRAFEADQKAQELCLMGLEKDGWKEELLKISKSHYKFFCMPLTHSENLQHQEMSVKLNLDTEGEVAVKNHLRLIQRFGRFPARNEALGRTSTPEETEFLTNEWDGWFKPY
eukprot:TRINITY_DN68686_c0_g1_i1.p1 TRINITY_DN68686_c0_g1~~TRINITY_DN68686_c0_g1_i1.p1  ORF type:complete len:197 (-),score=17.45 TRINITY_DN68686_c0_g1_i1:68-658(-)